MARLVVIVGAGASFDCVSPAPAASETPLEVLNPPLRPPLVTELFESRVEFKQILHKYPLAEAAAADIRPAIESGSVAIERFLRERLRDSDDAYAQKRYRQVPLYLQELLFTVSRTDGEGYTIHPDNYDALINATVPVAEVLFISLNYDTLLDQRLFIYTPLEDISSYVGQDWSLFKLHGSVNWGRPVVDARVAANPDVVSGHVSPAALNQFFTSLGPEDLEPEIVLRGDPSLERTRIEPGRVYYPALAVPVGEHDELVCPPAHLDVLRARLAEVEPYHLLVLGYSGLDQEVLQLLHSAAAGPAQMIVVNGSWDAGAAAATAINQVFASAALLEDQIYAGGFSDFVRSGELQRFVDAVG